MDIENDINNTDKDNDNDKFYVFYICKKYGLDQANTSGFSLTALKDVISKDIGKELDNFDWLECGFYFDSVVRGSIEGSILSRGIDMESIRVFGVYRTREQAHEGRQRWFDNKKDNINDNSK